jgi:very-short-patch-repair endonuclease
MGPITNKKCTRCNVNHPIENFSKKRNGEYMKMCDRCRRVNRIKAQNRKCEHGRMPEKCKECKVAPKRHKLCDGHIQRLCRYECNRCHSRSFASHMRAQYWDYEKNNTDPRNLFKSSDRKCWFICPDCNHSFDSTLSNIIAGKWCPYCSKPTKKLCDDNECDHCHSRSVASHENAAYWDTSKNDLMPRDILLGAMKKYWFICPDCQHSFDIAPGNLCKGKWCPYCSKPPKKICEDDNCEFCHAKSFAGHEKAEYWDYEKNDVDPRDVLQSSAKKRWFRCGICDHSFETYLSAIKRGTWCPYCSNPPKKLCKDDNCEFCHAKSLASHEKSKYWSDKNTIRPRDIFRCSDTKRWFDCHICDNDFETTPRHVVEGKWCPYCKNKTENKLYRYLVKLKHSPERQVKFSWCKNIRSLPFDFVIDNIIIELDGIQHFKQVSNWDSPEQIQERDRYKEQCALNHGYFIIRLLQEEVWNDKFDWKTLLNKAMEFTSQNEPCVLNIIAQHGNMIETRPDSIFRFWH